MPSRKLLYAAKRARPIQAPVVKSIARRPTRLTPPPLPGELRDAQKERFAVWQATSSGSFPEFIVWEWLVTVKRQRPGVDFLYQHPVLGGRTIFGGFVTDFYFPLRRMVWNVQGLYYHFTKTTDRARDMLAKAILSARGLLVVYLYEDDLLDRPDYTLNHAWSGEEVGARRFQ